MKSLDWQMITFVGISLLQEYWCYFGLPRVYYWETNHDDRHKAA